MNHLNSILLEGNITTNPSTKWEDNETLSARFTIASDRFYKDGEGNWQKNTLFMPILCRGELANFAEETLSKGLLIRVTGRIKATMRFKDGVQYPTFEILAQSIQFDKKNEENSDEPETSDNTHQEEPAEHAEE